MSYREKIITIYLISTLLLFGFYLINIIPMLQEGELDPTAVYTLWIIIVVLGILITIVATIIIHIIFGIIYAVTTNEEPTFDDIEDERDKLIELRGTRNSYAVLGTGMFISMVAQIVSGSSLVMFSLLLFFMMIAEIIGGISRLYFYRRGF